MTAYRLITRTHCPECPRWKGLLAARPVREALAAQGADWSELPDTDPTWQATVDGLRLMSVPALLSPEGRLLHGNITIGAALEFIAREGGQ